MLVVTVIFFFTVQGPHRGPVNCGYTLYIYIYSIFIYKLSRINDFNNIIYLVNLTLF